MQILSIKKRTTLECNIWTVFRFCIHMLYLDDVSNTEEEKKNIALVLIGRKVLDIVVNDLSITQCWD